MYKDIQNKFNDISQKYDSQRKKLIPCFEDFYSISTAIAETDLDNPKILDLGAGTGIFSEYILKKYPKASLTLIDISEKMLEISKLRFKNENNIKYIFEDYLSYDFNEKYDIIISSLSIHHLIDEEKFKLFKKCYSLLNIGGIFINADQFQGETPYIESLNKKLWKLKIENSDLSTEELLSCYERIKLDKEATLSQHIKWFKECGFSDIGCVYKYHHFGVICGRKNT
ncbi:class I SAM-dependent methyltransferase [Clostridium sp.]|uniref:class I SAM-dependent methyltransferase n=1 Tax=Clostridium sp. TaxID=1506 RepID=UPI00283C7372|nr:class I SAM-dependent methyltransferase [Clostridium sp.]MDR3597465.1 class I SAM-dependent methyltransferase [Clostridium sp.]